LRVRICDLLTGRRILDLPFLQASWTAELNTAETLSAKVDINDRTIQRLDLYNASWPGKTALIIEDSMGITRGGPIWTREYDRDAGTVTLNAKGMWSYFDHRVLLPLMQPTDKLTNPDGTANTRFDTSITNTSYQNIAKKWIQQSTAWTGGNLPITYENDLTGTYERNIKGAETKLIGDLLSDLTDIENGPDIEFIPQRTTDGLGYQWLLKTGNPRITAPTTLTFDTSTPKHPITNLTITDDATNLATQIWETGGASTDTAIIERATSPTLLNQGYPFYEKVETLSSTVTQTTTALAKAAEAIRTSQRPMHSWSFSVRRDSMQGAEVGSMVSIKTRHDLFGIPDDRHEMRILGLEGDSDSDSIKVTTGAIYG
jgi:hypothetical protein